MSHQAGRYKAHLQSCTNFKTNKADAHRKLTAAEAGMGATWEGAAPGGSARSVTSSVTATSAYYMSMSAAHAEAVNVAYAEAVFASGGKFGYCTDDDEWAAFYSKLVGPVWLPPLRSLMSPKYVNTVFHKVDASMHAVLASLVGRFYQCDGWTGPNGEQVFCVSLGAPLPFYVSSSRIAGRRESADTLVDKIKEQLSLVENAAEESWQTFHDTGFVTDSPNVNHSARTQLLEADVFSFGYGCASHA